MVNNLPNRHLIVDSCFNLSTKKFKLISLSNFNNENRMMKWSEKVAVIQ